MNFTTNATVNLVSGFMTVRIWCEKIVKKINNNLWNTGSLPNKLLMLGLNSAAAYAVGVNPVYIATMVIFTTFFCLSTTPRWLLEAAVITNLIIIATSTLPEANVTQLEYLILFKIIFELICSAMDKGIQLFASLAKDGKHSYYLFFLIAVATAKFLIGFGVGFCQGYYGL